MDAATKDKYPGRVSQRHKLVAFNRERKKALKEQRAEQPVEQRAEQPAEQKRQVSTSQALCGSGAVVIIAGAVAWYFWSAKKPPEIKTAPRVDIFAMR